MLLKASKIRLQTNEDNQCEIVLTTKENRFTVQKQAVELKQIIDRGKALAVEIKQHREKRSLDANSYAWQLITKIAEAMSKDKGHIYTKDEVYIEMLKRYGQREPKLLSVVADAVDMVYRATQNHCMEVGESELNGKVFKHLAILIGSSQYNSKEMSILIDGIVSEAKELDIEVLTPRELAILKESWGEKPRKAV